MFATWYVYLVIIVVNNLDQNTNALMQETKDIRTISHLHLNYFGETFTICFYIFILPPTLLYQQLINVILNY